MVNKFTEAQKKRNAPNESRTLKRRTRDRPVISDIMKKFENVLKVQNKNEFRFKKTQKQSRSDHTHLTSAGDSRDDVRTREKCLCYVENQDHSDDGTDQSQTFTSEIVSKGEVKVVCSCVVVEWSENEFENRCVMTEEPHPEMNTVTICPSDVWTLASYTDSLIQTEAFQHHKTKHTETSPGENIQINTQLSHKHLLQSSSSHKPSDDLHQHHTTLTDCVQDETCKSSSSELNPTTQLTREENLYFISHLKRRTDEDQSFSSPEHTSCESQDMSRSEICVSSDEDTGDTEVLDEISRDPRTPEHQTREQRKYKSVSYCDPSVKITHTFKTIRFTDTFNF